MPLQRKRSSPERKRNRVAHEEEDVDEEDEEESAHSPSLPLLPLKKQALQVAKRNPPSVGLTEDGTLVDFVLTNEIPRAAKRKEKGEKRWSCPALLEDPVSGTEEIVFATRLASSLTVCSRKPPAPTCIISVEMG